VAGTLNSRRHGRLPIGAHEAHPWLIAQIAPDFKLLDAWALPVEGGPDGFAALLDVMASLDATRAESAPTRALFLLRRRLGRWFGWDEAARPRPIPGCTETTLRARLPRELRGTATGPATGGPFGFKPLYRTASEWAAELSNETVHGVLHLAWVEQGNDLYRPQMGVYVKPRGRLGAAYLALIQPFRHLVVYPALMRQIGRAWSARASSPP
jgi:hypothetical protein